MAQSSTPNRSIGSPCVQRFKMSNKEKGVNVQVLLRCRYFEQVRKFAKLGFLLFLVYLQIGWSIFSTFVFFFLFFFKKILVVMIFGLIFRPFSNDELRNNAPQVVTCNDYQREVAVSQNIAGKHIDRIFTFDKVMCLLFDYFN